MILEIVAALASFGLGAGIYLFLANSEYYEWSRRTKRFEDWRKKEKFKDLKHDKVTGRILD